MNKYALPCFTWELDIETESRTKYYNFFKHFDCKNAFKGFIIH